MMKFKEFKVPIPVGNSLLCEIEIDEDKVVKSSILHILPSSQNEQKVIFSSTVGKIVDIAPDAQFYAFAKNPESSRYKVKIGDFVLFLQNAGNAYVIDGKHYRAIKPGDILLKIGESK